MSSAEYEWGVVHSKHPDEIHRGPMSEVEARDWIREAEELHFIAGAFYLARRTVGPWVRIDGSPDAG